MEIWPIGNLDMKAIIIVFITLVSLAVRVEIGAAQVAGTPDQLREPSSLDELKFFENEVRPVLATKCIGCHGSDKQEGGLRLDNAAGFLKGGDSGESLITSDIASNYFLKAIHRDGIEMPPDEPLSEKELASLDNWIKSGLPWPKSAEVKLARVEREFGREEKEFWFFQPIRKPVVPMWTPSDTTRNEIDAFIQAKLKEVGLAPASPTEKLIWARRASYDVTGLPPNADLLRDFLEDNSEKAYERFVDGLLASRGYAERSAQQWLDLVRYADSDGYKQDSFRPQAYRYRNYVIDSFHNDKPFDHFVREQIAGDEIAPNDPAALVATGYLRQWIYEYNQRDSKTQWDFILNDITDTTGDAFLGLGLTCARCHDHKYDPIRQTDYFRLQAFFSGILPQDNVPVVTPEVLSEYETKLQVWNDKTIAIRDEMKSLEASVYEPAYRIAYQKFPPEIQAMFEKAEGARSPREKQLVALANLQVVEETNKIEYEKKLKGDALTRWKELKAELEKHNADRPVAPASAMTVIDVGPVAAENRIPGAESLGDIQPGYLSVLNLPTPQIAPIEGRSSGRRTALANWMTSRENPLVARVIANRLWQRYFGKGLVATVNDFGKLGDRPSHPELLDYLAITLMESNWSLKHLQREILLSYTYRQSSSSPTREVAMSIDPQNRLLWRHNSRRLDGEEIRDTMLACSGKLVDYTSGPAVDDDRGTRSIYLKVMRNQRHPALDAFDFPDRIRSVGERLNTNTSLQALFLFNSKWSIGMAKQFSERVLSESKDNTEDALRKAVSYAWGRLPSESELGQLRDAWSANTQLAEQEGVSGPAARARGFEDVCHSLLSSNEFLFLD